MNENDDILSQRDKLNKELGAQVGEYQKESDKQNIINVKESMSKIDEYNKEQEQNKKVVQQMLDAQNASKNESTAVKINVNSSENPKSKKEELIKKMLLDLLKEKRSDEKAYYRSFGFDQKAEELDSLPMTYNEYIAFLDIIKKEHPELFNDSNSEKTSEEVPNKVDEPKKEELSEEELPLKEISEKLNDHGDELNAYENQLREDLENKNNQKIEITKENSKSFLSAFSELKALYIDGDLILTESEKNELEQAEKELKDAEEIQVSGLFGKKKKEEEKQTKISEAKTKLSNLTNKFYEEKTKKIIGKINSSLESLQNNGHYGSVSSLQYDFEKESESLSYITPNKNEDINRLNYLKDITSKLTEILQHVYDKTKKDYENDEKEIRYEINDKTYELGITKEKREHTSREEISLKYLAYNGLDKGVSISEVTDVSNQQSKDDIYQLPSAIGRL